MGVSVTRGGRVRYGFWVSVVSMVVLVAQTTAPSPFYPEYQERWGLSPVMLAVIFAVYVVGLLVVLLTAGALSDYIGRKPVIITAGILALAGLLLLAWGGSVVALIVGRVLQGACVGLIAGALGAALIDFHLPGKIRLSAVLNGALPPLALAIGAIAAAGLSVVMANATHLVYLVFAVAVLVCTILWMFVPEPVHPRQGALASLRPSLSIPPQTRSVFLAVLGALCASWALAGLYVGSAASITHQSLGLTSPLASGLTILALQVPGAVAGSATARFHARTVIFFGLGALLIGGVLTIIALTNGSVWGFFAATVIAGAGFGGAFQSGLRLILAETPDNTRSQALSSVYVVTYLAFGIPSIIDGFLTPVLGFAVTLYLYLAFVCVLAAVAFLIQLRSRPAERSEQEAEVEESLETLDDTTTGGTAGTGSR